MQVHIDRGGERFGPYSLEEVNAYLANGTLLPTDNAWQDGMANWVPIDQIPGVTMAVGSTPPTPSTPPAAGATCPQCQAPVEASQVICMGCGTRLQGEATTPKGSKKKLLIGIGAGVGVLAIIAGIWFFLVREDGTNEQGVETKKSELPKAVPEKLIADPIVEKAIREKIKKPTGELTKADLDKVTRIHLHTTKITDAGLKEVAKLQKLAQLSLYATDEITDAGLKEVAKLQQLTYLNLESTKVTKAGVAELQKALPKCNIDSNPTK